MRSFLPAPLPPKPPLAVGPATWERLNRALLALGRLDSVSSLLPNTGLFLDMYLRKEAVLSWGPSCRSLTSCSSNWRRYQGFRPSPLGQVGTVAKAARLAEPTVATVFKKMTKLGLVREVTGKHRNWIFGYDPYLPILSEGTEVE